MGGARTVGRYVENEKVRAFSNSPVRNLLLDADHNFAESTRGEVECPICSCKEGLEGYEIRWHPVVDKTGA